MISSRIFAFFAGISRQNRVFFNFKQMSSSSSSSSSSSEDEQPKQVKEESPKKEKKTKKRKADAEEEPAKVGKPSSKKPKEEVTGRMKDADGNEMFEFGNMRYASISNFKGKEYLNIREYYMDKKTGQLAPSRKGISLTKAQWSNLKDLIPEIDAKMQ